MIESKEKEGCKAIVLKLTSSELHSLFETVTKRQIAAYSENEMVNAILTFSESALELLKRKKVRRDVLFQYLTDNNVPISVSAEKLTIITKILDFWGSKISATDILVLKEESNSSSSTYSLSGDDLASPVHRINEENEAMIRLSNEANTNINTHNSVSSLSNANLTNPVARTDESSTKQLGETFASWHYKVLNAHNPMYQGPPQDSEYGSQHFWNDAKLTLKSITQAVDEEEFEGSELVAGRILALVKEELLIFNPNITEDGVKTQLNRHGLVVICVCGTLHRGNDCLGIFEQMFGLIKDPRFDNNYKIKFTKLKIVSSQVTKIPRLQDSAADNFLTLPATS